jgi:hypothetical protein
LRLDELFHEDTRASADAPFDCLQEEVVAGSVSDVRDSAFQIGDWRRFIITDANDKHAPSLGTRQGATDSCKL